jgi:hypothetical protein
MFDLLTQAFALCASHPFLASASGASMILFAAAPVAEARQRKLSLAQARIARDQLDLADWIGAEAYIHLEALAALHGDDSSSMEDRPRA